VKLDLFASVGCSGPKLSDASMRMKIGDPGVCNALVLEWLFARRGS
jgi:hypothetical protein